MVFSTPCLQGVVSPLSKALALLVGIIGDSLFRVLLFLPVRPTVKRGGMVYIIVSTGSNIPAHLLDKPFKAVRVFLLQLRIFGFREENILVLAIGRGQLPTRSLCLALF